MLWIFMNSSNVWNGILKQQHQKKLGLKPCACVLPNQGFFLIINQLISFRIQTVLRAIKQTQVSVDKVRFSIEDRLLQSQSLTQKVCRNFAKG